MNTLNKSKIATGVGSSKRNIELGQLVAVFAQILTGLAFESTAKLATHPATANAVNINVAESATLARTLDIPRETAKALVEDREARRGHRFGSGYDLRHAKILKLFTISSAVPV